MSIGLFGFLHFTSLPPSQSDGLGFYRYLLSSTICQYNLLKHLSIEVSCYEGNGLCIYAKANEGETPEVYSLKYHESKWVENCANDLQLNVGNEVVEKIAPSFEDIKIR